MNNKIVKWFFVNLIFLIIFFLFLLYLLSSFISSKKNNFVEHQIQNINKFSDKYINILQQPIYQESIKTNKIVKSLFKHNVVTSCLINRLLENEGKVFVFNSDKKLVFSSITLSEDQKSVLEKYYNWITTPVDDYQDYPSGSFENLRNILPDIENNSVVLRVSPKNRLIELHQDKIKKDRIICGGIWLNSEQDGVFNGVLVYKSLPNCLSIENIDFVKRTIAKKGFNVGYLYLLEGKTVVLPPKGFKKEEFLDAYAKYKLEISDIVAINHKKVYFREAGNDVIYAYEIFEGRCNTKDVIFYVIICTIFLIVDWFIAYQTYLLLVTEQGIKFKLEYKLIFLFVVGVILPVLVSKIVSDNYIKRLEYTYLLEEYKDLNSKLEKIDVGFNFFLSKRANIYARKFDNACFDDLKKLLKDFADKFIIFEGYLIGSDTRLITKTIAPYFLQNYRLAKLAYDKRLKLLERWAKYGWKPIKKDWVFWHPNYNPNMHEKKPANLSVEYNNPLLKTLQTVTLDLIDYYNKLNNITNTTSVKEDIKKNIGEVVSPAFSDFLRRFRKLLDKFSLVEIHLGSSIIFTKVIGDKENGGKAFVFLAQDFPSFQGIYLDFVRKKYIKIYSDRVYWKAVFSKGFLNPFFEFYEILPFYEKIRAKFLSSNKTYLNFERVYKGTSYLISVKEGSYLKHFLLIAMKSREKLEKKIHIVRQKITLALLVVFIFEIILVFAFLNRLIVPLNAISEGITNIVNHKKTEYIHFPVIDEVGVLCEEYNKLIDFLKEMEIGSVLQKAFLPKYQLEYKYLVVNGINKMAQGVGGDYFDYFILPNGKLAILLADVAGHGISAALATAMAKAAFNIACCYYCEKPSDALCFINELFFDILQKKKMLTCWLGYIDCLNDSEFEILYTNAGQTFPFVIDIYNKTIYQLQETSLPLGVVKKSFYKTYSCKLQRKHILLLYSDCLIEARDNQGKEIGIKKLQDLVIKALNVNFENIHLNIIDFVEKSIYPEVLPDDATILVLRWKNNKSIIV